MKVHSFYIEDAEKYGVDKAVLLYNLKFWLEKVKANDKDDHKHDGYYWTYNSAKAFAKLFPYYHERKIARMLQQLEDDGIILSGTFNKVAYDRTKWYSMPDFSICQNCQMKETEITNENDETVQPIPDSNTNNNPDSNPSTKSAPKKTTYQPVKPNDLDQEIWQDLLEMRKRLKTGNSKTAWTRIFNALAAAQQATGHSLDTMVSFWIMKEWKGFDSKWYLNAISQNKGLSHGQAQQPAAQRYANGLLEQAQQQYGQTAFGGADANDGGAVYDMEKPL